ncbi:DNA-directed RNA polymerase V subunit 7-like [Pyrus ussuriensis x Pyrus communis]|uniref:DNA-directed RNA polymerase V subunit 7-like n=1 Tax=Pyrus ussuriensis x Pyrus communis TaxID=2448454 RepID=A0A5N5I4X6_9ROSA|nr:DNA-directed RNA polymerase V subunit 7-like [Pyrus ussuriensis x Pyrus communis]
MLQKLFIVRLLEDLALKNATKDLVGECKVRKRTGDVLFPVVLAPSPSSFSGERFFLSCGPVENMYVSKVKVPDYDYVPGENPVFMNSKMSKLEKGTMAR